MHVTTVQILWHNKKPVLSLDFQTDDRLVTAGADDTIRVRAAPPPHPPHTPALPCPASLKPNV